MSLATTTGLESGQHYLTPDQLHRALSIRDLTDAGQGHHAIQTLLDDVVAALSSSWGSSVREVRSSPIVPIRENYDRLGYRPGDVTRARRYTRYISPTVMLRSHTSAAIPAELDRYAASEATEVDVDELLVAPGLVYRRDVVDRNHVGEPHQVDLWRVRRARSSDDDLLDMARTLVDTVLPNADWHLTEAIHPYTEGGKQVDVHHAGEWRELAECGRIHPDVLRRCGLDPQMWSGLALGMGLERALMLRKGIPDIRYLRATEPRIAAQMRDLEPWQQISLLPPARRDISIVVSDKDDEETLGDRIRDALSGDVDVIESLEVLASTPHDELPEAARTRLRTLPGQANVLLRIVLRPVDRTLSSAEANTIRNRIYLAVHEGPVQELI